LPQACGLGAQLPFGHVNPEQQVQISVVSEIAASWRGGGTSFRVPLQVTTTGSGAPKISAVHPRMFGLLLQNCFPSTWPYQGPPRTVQSHGNAILTSGCALSLKNRGGEIAGARAVGGVSAALLSWSVLDNSLGG
jgi:hypothetical protein